MIKLTGLRGELIEVEFKDIRGQVGGNKQYTIYSMANGKRIKVKETLAQIRAQNEAPATHAQEVEEVLDDDEES